MRTEHLPTDSRRYSERAFEEKKKWHRRQGRMSLTRKIEVLDRLLEAAKHLPKLQRDDRELKKGAHERR